MALVSRCGTALKNPRFLSLSAQSCSLAHPVAQRLFLCQSSKGFGGDTNVAPKQVDDDSTQDASSVDALEAQIRGKKAKKQGKIEPQVKVIAPVVDAVTGKAPVTTASQAETAVVLGLFYFFLLILIEGLLLAGSGFLPEEMDQWVQDKIYPGYSPTVLLFLGCSSLYGLFKVGRLPGQTQN